MPRLNVSSAPRPPQRAPGWRGASIFRYSLAFLAGLLLLGSTPSTSTLWGQERPRQPRSPEGPRFEWYHRYRPAPARGAVLGVEFREADDPERHRDGVRLSGVSPGSAADEADLEAGDAIIRFDGVDLTRPLPEGEEEIDGELAPAPARLMYLTRDLEPGQEVTLTVRRGTEEREVELIARRWAERWAALRLLDPDGPLAGLDTIRIWPPPEPGDPLRFRLPPRPRGEAPRLPEAWRFFPDRLPGFGAAPRRFGLQIYDMNPGLARYFGRDTGALILNVDEDAPLRLEPGDVIASIGDREVEDTEHARRILASYRSGERVTMEVWREGSLVRVEGEAP